MGKKKKPKLSNRQLFILFLFFGILFLFLLFNPFSVSNKCHEFTFYETKNGGRMGSTRIGCPEEEILKLNAELEKAKNQQEVIKGLIEFYKKTDPVPVELVKRLVQFSGKSEERAVEIIGLVNKLENFSGEDAEGKERVLGEVFTFLDPRNEAPNFRIKAEQEIAEYKINSGNTKIASLILEVERLQTKVSSLITKVDSLREENMSLQERLNLALSESARLNQQKKELERRLSQLNRLISDLKRNETNNSSKIKELEALSKDLQDQNNELDAALSKVAPVRITNIFLGSSDCKLKGKNKVYPLKCIKKKSNGIKLSLKVELNLPEMDINSQYFKDEFLTISLNIAPYRATGNKQQLSQKQRIKAGTNFNKKLDDIFPNLEYVKGTYDLKITYYPYIDKPIFSDVVKVQ